MKTKAIVLLFLGIILIGCDDNPLEKSHFYLKDTHWKLAGYMNTTDGKLIEAKPQNNEKYFTLAFENDSVGTGKTVFHTIEVQLYSEPIIKVPVFTFILEGGNVDLFYEAIKTVDSFKVDENELKFFYNGKKNYLLYKQIAAPEVN